MRELNIQSKNAKGSILAWAIPVVLVLVTAAVFWPALTGQFTNWDDDQNFVENLSFRGLGSAQLKWALTTYHMGVWQPLAWLLLGAEYAARGLEPWIYHATSVGLHAANAVLFYFVMVTLLRIGDAARRSSERGRDRLVAGLVALLFATHPLRVEAVAWVSCQPYLPAVMFFLLGVLCYLRWAESEKVYWWAATLICYVAAVMCKAAAVSLPIVLLLLDWYPLRRAGLRAVVEKLPFFVVAVLASVWAAAAKDYSDTRVPFREFDASARLAQSAFGLMFYLAKTAWPTGLNAYYRMPVDISLGTARYLLCALGVVGISAAGLLLRRRWPAFLVCWAAYVVIVLPNLGLVQIGQQIAADRYAYLATMPVLVLAAAGAASLLGRLKARSGSTVAIPGVAVLIVGALSLETRRLIPVWRNSEALWSNVLHEDPRSAVAACNLATAQMSEQRFGEAEEWLRKAVHWERDFAFAYSNLGVIYLYTNRLDEAAVVLNQSLVARGSQRRMDLAKTHATLGAVYAAQRKDNLAWKHTLLAEELGHPKAASMIEYLKKFSPDPRLGASSKSSQR